MSGHSKWATIKRKKGAADAKRGQVFTKLIKELTVAARMGGGDVSGNPRLRRCIDTARAASMPTDNIERAIKKGTGELEGVHYEEVAYEGYGPAGVALYIESLTDNKNRTVAELRNLLSKKNGNLGEHGCVSWMFHKKGYLSFDKKEVSEEKLMDIALEAGAEDVRDAEDSFEVMTEPNQFDVIKEALTKAGLKPLHAEISMIPQNTVRLDLGDAEKMLRLMEALEDHEDVQKVYANFDIPADILEKISS